MPLFHFIHRSVRTVPDQWLSSLVCTTRCQTSTTSASCPSISTASAIGWDKTRPSKWHNQYNSCLVSISTEKYAFHFKLFSAFLSFPFARMPSTAIKRVRSATVDWLDLLKERILYNFDKTACNIFHFHCLARIQNVIARNTILTAFKRCHRPYV